MSSTCREQIENFLCDYACGELPEEQRAEFERHLAICPACRTYVENYTAAIKCSRVCSCHIKNPELAAVPDALVKAILAARAAKKPD